jgi:hypothetical protein
MLLMVEHSAYTLLYFMLELADAFLELSDDCFLCRAPRFPGLQPVICTGLLCSFHLTEIDVGNRVFQEIQREPMGRLSIFSGARGHRFSILVRGTESYRRTSQ